MRETGAAHGRTFEIPPASGGILLFPYVAFTPRMISSGSDSL